MYTLFSFVSWGCHHNHSSTLPNAYTKLLERRGGKQVANRWQEMPQHLHRRKKKKQDCRGRGQHWDGLASWGCNCLGAHAKDCALRTKEKKSCCLGPGLMTKALVYFLRMPYFLNLSARWRNDESPGHGSGVFSCAACNGRETRISTRVKYIVPWDSFSVPHA